MILLDTDIFTHLTQGQAKVADRYRAAIGAEQTVAITIVTRAEVLRGRLDRLLKASSADEIREAQKWLRASEQALAAFPIVEFDEATESEWERLKRVKGLSMGHCDRMIAALARSRAAVLVTRNRKHFAKVPGLTIDNWAD
jgi:tRNA(fMet)-specific endonuclease VapC